MRVNGNSSLFFIVLALAVSACGSSSSTSPVAPSPSNPSPPSQATIGPVLSGENSMPVSGAPVQVAGQMMTTGVDGTIHISSSVPMGSTVQVDASGFLAPMQTRFANQSLLLWPNRPGFDENFTKQLVYGAETQMLRVDGPVSIVPDPEFQDAVSLSLLAQAAQIVTAANGRFTFTVVASNPGAGIVFRIYANTGNVTTHKVSYPADRPVLTGGDIGLVTRASSGSLFRKVAAHEMAHAFGFLGHNTGCGNCIMYNGALSSSTLEDFSPEEKLAMRMMVIRKSGNYWPDTDLR